MLDPVVNPPDAVTGTLRTAMQITWFGSAIATLPARDGRPLPTPGGSTTGTINPIGRGTVGLATRSASEPAPTALRLCNALTPGA